MPRKAIHKYERGFVVGINGDVDLDALTQLAEYTKHDNVGSVNVSSVLENECIPYDPRSSLPRNYSNAKIFYVSYVQEIEVGRNRRSRRNLPTSMPTSIRDIPLTILDSMHDLYASAKEKYDMAGFGFFEFNSGQSKFNTIR